MHFFLESNSILYWDGEPECKSSTELLIFSRRGREQGSWREREGGSFFIPFPPQPESSRGQRHFRLYCSEDNGNQWLSPKNVNRRNWITSLNYLDYLNYVTWIIEIDWINKITWITKLHELLKLFKLLKLFELLELLELLKLLKLLKWMKAWKEWKQSELKNTIQWNRAHERVGKWKRKSNVKKRAHLKNGAKVKKRIPNEE